MAGFRRRSNVVMDNGFLSGSWFDFAFLHMLASFSDMLFSVITKWQPVAPKLQSSKYSSGRTKYSLISKHSYRFIGIEGELFLH